MDTDAYTCGQCKHGNFYDQCGQCEDDYERKRKAATTRQKLGEAWAPWMDKKPEPTSKPCELMALEKKIMELADAYAVAASMTFGEPSLKRLIDNATTRAALLAEVTRATDLIDDLVRELRYIEGISNGQVQRVAKQVLATLPINAEVSGLSTRPPG